MVKRKSCSSCQKVCPAIRSMFQVGACAVGIDSVLGRNLLMVFWQRGPYPKKTFVDISCYMYKSHM